MKTDIGLRYKRESDFGRKRKISIVNGTPRTQEDLEKFLDPMYFLKSTKIQKFNEFDYEIQQELSSENKHNSKDQLTQSKFNFNN